MTQIVRYTSDYPTISAIIEDEGDSNYLWIAYNQDTDGICHLEKVSSTTLNQVYYDVEVEVDQIIDMDIYNGYIYLLVDDDTYCAKRYSTSNPYSTTTYSFTTRPEVTETPVGITVMSSYVYILYPGAASGTNAKVYRYSATGTYNTVIDLDEPITNASSITNDGTNVWVISNEDPGKLVKIYYSGEWLYTTTTLE